MLQYFENASVVALGGLPPGVTLDSLQTLFGRKVDHIGLATVCAGLGGSWRAAAYDWVVSFGAPPHTCAGAFVRALHDNRRGVLWSPLSAPPPVASTTTKWWERAVQAAPSALQLLGYSRNIAIKGPYNLSTFVKHASRANAHCSASRASTNGSFLMQERKWPIGADHYLDPGVADCITGLARGKNASVVDIGGGSGLYGAYFHMRLAPKGSGNLVFPMGPYGNLTIAPGGNSHFSAFKCGAGCTASGQGGIHSWSTFDGTPGIEDLTHDLGPPGALVRNADLCDPTLAWPAHDWSMSLEVGEHLPSSCLANFMALLTDAGSLGLVLSWSQHTTGTCHINPRRVSLLESALPYWGYVVDHEATHHCRHRAMLPWLRAGVIVARKPGAAGRVQ